MTQGATQVRQENAAALLSTTGAALGGIGIGVLLGEELGRVGLPALVIGLFVHIIGMMGKRRVQAGGGYEFSRLETSAYWLCWFLIAIVLGYAAATGMPRL